MSVGRWSTEQFRKHMCSILSRGQAEEIEAMRTPEKFDLGKVQITEVTKKIPYLIAAPIKTKQKCAVSFYIICNSNFELSGRREGLISQRGSV